MLSIIIPAHNEEKYIGACLQSIKNQKFSDYEIIVVCDSCTDKTKQITQKYTKKVYEIKKKNVSAARNFGARKATGDVLVFLDADSVIASNLLVEINKAVKKGYIGGVTKTKSLEDIWKANMMWALGNFFRHFYITASGVFFCKANEFTGYDESCHLAEDTDLILKLKQKGKLKYITNSYIKTSSRRLETEGYFWTIFRQFSAFFTGTKKGY
ncbi:glycosyltransferase family 2 protein [Candidatus Woesearchaeota archaeon]|nr:glycosyltransferase family 2 protein [Candidatus Woesearchaeota archaeon]